MNYLRHAWLALALCLPVERALAQQAAPVQDPKLDNLVHAPGYATVELGSLGAVVERGTGSVPMVLVSGFGVGASAFAGFLERNATRYHMFAVTLAGFEGTAAPPMPPARTSYGEQTWTKAAVGAVVELMRERGLDRPVIVGHFVNGTQVAARVAIEHPELVRALVLLAGSPRFEPLTATSYWPRDMTREKKVAQVDDFLAPRWFRTVTRETWVNGNFKDTDYSLDAARGRAAADGANAPPLPVLIRWLCEFHASDLVPDLEPVALPLLLIQPSFTEALRSDTNRSYLAGYFAEPWKGIEERRPQTEVSFLDDAGILVMDDKPAEVERAIAGFLERNAH